MNNEHFVVIKTMDSNAFNKLKESFESRKLDPRNCIISDYDINGVNTMIMYIKNLTQDQVIITCMICKQVDAGAIRVFIDMDGVSEWMSNY